MASQEGLYLLLLTLNTEEGCQEPRIQHPLKAGKALSIQPVRKWAPQCSSCKQLNSTNSPSEQKTDSFLDSSERITALTTPQFQFGETQTSDLQICSLCCFKTLNLWQSVLEATENSYSYYSKLFCSLLLTWRNIKNVFLCHQIFFHNIILRGLLEFHGWWISSGCRVRLLMLLTGRNK